MKQIMAIQHCQSEHHVNGMVGGATEWPLTPLGRKQAQCIGQALAGEATGGWVLLTSDQQRALETAQEVGAALRLTPQLRPALREVHLGSATGKSGAWFTAHKQAFDPAREAWIDHRYLPDAESHREAYGRVATVVEEIEQSAQNQFIVVTHGGALNLFIARWLGLSVEDCNRMSFRSQAGSLARLSEMDTGQRLLQTLNDRSSWLGRI